MNPWMISALADSHSREIRLETARCRACAYCPRRSAHSAARWPQLRRGIGFRLVEAGLHLLATTRPAP